MKFNPFRPTEINSCTPHIVKVKFQPLSTCERINKISEMTEIGAKSIVLGGE